MSEVKQTSADEVVEVPLRLPHDHPIMQSRDHHILTYLREVSKLSGGSVGFPVAAIDQLWRSAYELGVACGTALKTHAELSKRQRGKKSPSSNPSTTQE
jgi:hypothetical protein